jgi:2-acylglycerol O-acyltransferase 2
LENGERIGIVPGGIAEIFEGFPKSGTHPSEEYCIVRRGFLKMAWKYKIPVVPIYCFGSTKLFRRIHLPVLERFSKILRVSLVVFFGQMGLPIPFRQKLLYVIGNPIAPDELDDHPVDEEIALNGMQKQFCDELQRIFERHKHSYGWGNKTLKLITR